jgi:succinate---hydroxymethylglutarate CoA-transferase
MGASFRSVLRPELQGRSGGKCLLPIRTHPQFSQDRLHGSRAHFISTQVNRNKKSLGLSFADPQGVDILHRLAASSDVLVENYLPGTLRKYQMDYDTVHNLNHR